MTRAAISSPFPQRITGVKFLSDAIVQTESSYQGNQPSNASGSEKAE